jgi:hypothetical protein
MTYSGIGVFCYQFSFLYLSYLLIVTIENKGNWHISLLTYFFIGVDTSKITGFEDPCEYNLWHYWIREL